MKAKDIIPIVEEGITIWIYGCGRWTMPKEDLIRGYGDYEVSKIDIGKNEIKLYVD